MSLYKNIRYLWLKCKLPNNSYASLQNQQIISRLKADTEIEKGSEINLFFDIRKMYFFDKLTGAKLK
jgi:hypothetical protein